MRQYKITIIKENNKYLVTGYFMVYAVNGQETWSRDGSTLEFKNLDDAIASIYATREQTFESELNNK